MILKAKTATGWLIVPNYFWFEIDGKNLDVMFHAGDSRSVSGVEEVYLMDAETGKTIDKIM